MMSQAHLQSVCFALVANVAPVLGKVQLKVAAGTVPGLWPGGVATVRSCDPWELGPDSIIVFPRNQRLIVHQLMHREVDRTSLPGKTRVLASMSQLGC